MKTIMTDEERLKALEKAQKLIRDVEFSYPEKHPIRCMLYTVVVENFSITRIGALISVLKKRI